MNKLHLAILLTPSLILAGCATTLDEMGCPAKRVDATLKAHDDGSGGGNGNGPSFIKISPDTVRVDKGCYFVLNNPDGREITTESPEIWLRHSATTDHTILIGPADGTKGITYKYTIIVTGFGKLDPRAHIKR